MKGIGIRGDDDGCDDAFDMISVLSAKGQAMKAQNTQLCKGIH